MDFSLIELILSFLFAIILGFSVGILYEAVKIFHILGYNKNSHYFISDFFFMIISGVITYFFCLVMLEGKVRVFVIVGEIVGFFAYYHLIAPFTAKIITPIIKISKKVFSKLLKKCGRIMYNIGSKFSCLFSFLKSTCKSAGLRVNKMVKNNGRKENKTKREKRRKNKRSKNRKEKNQ